MIALEIAPAPVTPESDIATTLRDLGLVDLLRDDSQANGQRCQLTQGGYLVLLQILRQSSLGPDVVYEIRRAADEGQQRWLWTTYGRGRE